MNRNHVVSRSGNPFPQVSTNMALEQSINADSKAKSVIVGISQRPGAPQRWFLTSHEREVITTSLKNMYGVEMTDRLGVAHTKASANSFTRDECDVSKLLACIRCKIQKSKVHKCQPRQRPLSQASHCCECKANKPKGGGVLS